MTEPGIEAAALKRCPFCGGEARLWPKGFSNQKVSCLDGCAEAISVQVWNRRPAASPDLRERIAETIRQWTSHSYMQLHAGEMTAQERRTVCAVVEAIERQVCALPGLDEEAYLVWSNEHRAWWGPNHRGYNTHLSHAGRYTRDEALAICVGARGGREFNRNPSETPVLLKDAEKFWADDALQKQYRRAALQQQEGRE